MPGNIIKTQWETYALAVLHEGASGQQIVETRRAFYAGAASLLSALTNIVGPEDEVTDEDVSILDGVHQELVEFARDVRNGEA